MTGRGLDDLAALLMARGHCDARTIERGQRMAGETGRRFDQVLLQLGLISERDLAVAFGALLALPLCDAAAYPTVPVLPERLGLRFLRDIRAMPLRIEDGCLRMAAADPLEPFLPAALTAATGLPVALEVALPIELDAAFARLYEGGAEASDAAAGATEAVGSEEDAERLKDLASEAPVIRMVNQLIARAVETRASDVHIEPFEDRLRIRYRYDGVLHQIEQPPAHLIPAITSRIKIMARLDIAERRLPQDGRIKLAVRGQDVDFRVSTIPSLHGETVVLRILDRSAVTFDYARLGLAPEIIEILRRKLALPNGIILVTGPTGSGKTTTLYTGLLGLNAVSRKIVTVEDPIEFQLNGISQIQVKPQIGLTFAHLLRAILRQDPDVIMVGEIRDLETAQIAVQAALTGHLVLSTLHTNSAAAAITRLRDMGLEDYLLSAVLRGVLAQRLVRRLCTQCREPVAAPADLVARFDLAGRARRRGMTGWQPVLWRPRGCAACRETGYSGRVAIAEFLSPDAEIERLIFAREDHATIERAAQKAGMATMLDAGLDAVLDGETTLEEVTNAIRAEH